SARLREWLTGQLPGYMVPAVVVVLAEMPRTPSGKLDRRALPAPTGSHPLSAPHIAPQTGLERTIAAIWQALLQIEAVGREDNFFELGGHSLLMVQVQHKLAAA